MLHGAIERSTIPGGNDGTYNGLRGGSAKLILAHKLPTCHLPAHFWIGLRCQIPSAILTRRWCIHARLAGLALLTVGA
jgi:hypothetical protein